MKKILVYTDSRGQHKPGNSDHKLFGERLRDEVCEVDVDLILCPMKWTTIIDFIEYSEQHDLSSYDWIILYLGIVDWSPRPASSAFHDLYNNRNESNTERLVANTRDYSKKTVNNKKSMFDKLVGEQRMIHHLTHPTNVRYQGEPTINMYSPEMALSGIIPRLKQFHNLVFINSNRILSYWNGDHKKGRPANMHLTHEHSDMFTRELPGDRVVDLRKWNDREIRKYTCDNLHLTKSGSDYIFDELVTKMNLTLLNSAPSKYRHYEKQMKRTPADLLQFKPIERYDANKKLKFLSNLGSVKYLGTLIIGFRITGEDDDRLDNLIFLLDWLELHYSDMFDILLVEQDHVQRFDPEKYDLPPYVRYEFIYNPQDYNRGWGYNVAVRHFCPNSSVVVLMDVDILPGANFVAEIRDCLIGRYDVISPYQNVYDTDLDEAMQVKDSLNFSPLKDEGKIRRATSITGGIVIFSRKTFMSIKGFEQYTGYSCEDRALDVTVMSLCDESKVRIAPHAYPHLYHPADRTARKNFKAIYAHLQENYKCTYSPKIKPTEFIHAECEHVNKGKVLELLIKRSKSFGDKDLYRADGKLLVNGIIENTPGPAVTKVLMPEDFRGLSDYEERELYKAPEPDSDELAKFYNAFVGERCFIIGNGPSLNKHDLSLLENEYTFAVNGIFYKTEECGFKPYFYVVEDSSVMKENITEIRNYDAPTYKFFPTVYKRLHAKTPNTFFFKMNRGFYEKSSPNFAVPRFSTDATKQLFCGQSVTHINLQLAYFMGFTEVYLIGMDFSYVIPDSHKRTGDVLLSDTDDDNHFNPNYFGKGKTWKDPKLDRVEKNYRMAKLVYESVGRKILNASVGGKLEVFDRVDFTSLFDRNDSAPRPRNSSNTVSNGPSHIAGVKKEIAGQQMPKQIEPVQTNPELSNPMHSPAPPHQPPAHQDPNLTHYARFALWLQSTNPTLFRLGQFLMWGGRTIKRHSLPALTVITILAGLLAGPVFLTQLTPFSTLLWGAAGGLTLLAILLLGISFTNSRMRSFADKEHFNRLHLKSELLREIKKQGNENVAEKKQTISQIERLQNRILEIERNMQTVQTELRADFETRLKAISSRLTNEIDEKNKDVIEGVENRLSETVSQLAGEIDEKNKHVIEGFENRLSETVSQLAGEIGEKNKHVIEGFENRLSETVSQLADEIDEKNKHVIEGFENRLSETVSQLASEVDEKNKSVIEGFENRLNETSGRLSIAIDQKHASIMNSMDKLTASAPVFNFGDYQPFNRKLTGDHITILTKEWSQKLGLSITPRSLSYLAHRICTQESAMHGRLATTIEDAVLRTLVAASVKTNRLRVLEIGTLFGIGLTMIFDYARHRFENVHLTAIDPLEGYYSRDTRDIITDETIDEQNLLRNFAIANIRETDFTLIKGMSTDDNSIEAARQGGEYDVLVIDGDHSYAGVKTDFIQYLPFVARGGYIIFDDYDAPNWPGVKQFVDEHVRKHQDVALVGTSWRTAVFRVVRKNMNRSDESARQ